MSRPDPIQSMARDLVRRGLGVPAIFLLESMKPFSVVAQQTLFATSPLTSLIGYPTFFGNLNHLFENRENMESLALELERLLEAPDGQE